MYLELILILEIRRALTIVTLIQLIKHCTSLNNNTFVNFRTWQETSCTEQTATVMPNSRNPEPTETQQVARCPKRNAHTNHYIMSGGTYGCACAALSLPEQPRQQV